MTARLFAAAAALTACSNAATTVTTSAACAATPAACPIGDGGASPLVAYACAGGARPDEAPRYVDGVPEGFVCADATTGDGGAPTWCCTPAPTTCAFNPVASCGPGFYGFECRGANRPEALNPRLACGQGVRRDALIDYCCAGAAQTPGCVQSDSVMCSTRLMGWTCMGDSLPRGEELGANRSRADSYALLCPVPTPAANAAYSNYCCLPPAPTPAGASCVQDTKVPGCTPGRFGFACYGADTPPDDYPPMRCPEPPVAGVSAQGYAARLYCCDLAPAP